MDGLHGLSVCQASFVDVGSKLSEELHVASFTCIANCNLLNGKFSERSSFRNM